MSTLKPFTSLYDEVILPALTPLEEERKQIVKQLQLYGLILIPVSALFFYFNAGLFPLIAGGVGLFFYYRHHAGLIKGKYKEYAIKTLVNGLDPNLAYHPTSRIERGDYDKSKLFIKSINRYYGDDLVSGVIGKTAIRFSEVFTQLERNNDEKQLDTIFRGIFFIADFNKRFIGETFVLPDVAQNIFGELGSFIQKLNLVRPQLVKLEDPEFEKAFVIYGTDQVEARYILSISLMQRILDFKKKTNLRLSLSFIDSQVFIALPINKNLFEAPSLFESVIKYQPLSEYYGYLSMCIEIVDTLDLNTRIWTKE